MPRRPRTKKTRKSYRRKKQRTTAICKSVKSFPERLCATLFYNDYIGISTSAGTDYYEIIMRGNSLYDPMYSGCTLNGQPLGRDQWANFYQSYVVRSCTARFTIQSGSSTAAGGSFIAILHANDTTTADGTTYADSPDTLMLQKDTIYKYVPPAGSAPQTQISMTKTSKYMMPNSNPESNVGGLASASSPTDGWYFHFTLWDMARNYASGTLAGYVDVQLQLHCEFYDPVDLPAS